MSVPPTPAFPGETPPESSAPNRDAPTAAGMSTQPTLPIATPRTTAQPQVEPPQNSPTFPPQPPASSSAPTSPPTPTPAGTYTSPPAPQQPVYTQPPAPSTAYPSTLPSPAAPHPQPPQVSVALPTEVSPPSTSAHRWRWIALAVAGVVLLATLGVGGFSLYATHEAQQPTLTAQAFCSDMETKQYTAAYHMLSSTYQAKTSQAQFVEDAGLHDQVDGPVAVCTVLHSSAPTGYTLQTIVGATLALRVTRHKPSEGSVTIIKEGTDWRVDTIASSLQGTTLAPLRVGITFCRALVAKDYAAAYNTFSSHERSGGTEAAFTATFTKAFGADLQITSCTPTVSSYTVTPDVTSATVDVAMQITLHVQGTGLVTIPATLGLVAENGAWKLDSIAIKSA